jgi:broad specificity phosphatase PhoE
MKLYFLRYGQTWVNADNAYSKDNKDSLSDLGQEQAEGLVSRLAEYTFKAIYVSPAERALHTILPYLKHTQQKAEIWTELIETCWQADHEALAPFRLEPRVRYEVPLELIAHFECSLEHNVLLPEDENYQEGMEHIVAAQKALLEKHSGTEDVVLVVGHGHAGGILLTLLQGKPLAESLVMDNTGLSCLQEMNSGQFEMEFFNRIK